MITNKKIKAFTLLELTVVMLISGVVFGIAYSAYYIVNKQYYQYQDIRKQTGELMLYQTVFRKDLIQADEIIAFSDGVELTMTNHQPVNYYFYPDYIIRETINKADTFSVKASWPETEELITAGHRPLVKTIAFDLDYKGNKIAFLFDKAYGTEKLVNSGKR